MNLRLFIALDIPELIKGEIGELVNLLSKHDTDVKWIKPENIHLTLKFLGSTPETLVAAIRESLITVASPYEPFHLTVQNTGAFPGEKRPRVLWIGVVDSRPLKSLRDRIERTLSQFGFQRDDKEFHPHLTLGRIRSQRGMIGLLNDLALHRAKNFGNFLVDEVVLMKSELHPKGSEYTRLYRIPFGIRAAV